MDPAAPDRAARRRLPYFLTVGGSSPLGCLGYVEAALELADQVARGDLPEPSHVVVALGSGGTAAGLAAGLRIAGVRSRVVGVVVNDRTPEAEHARDLAPRREGVELDPVYTGKAVAALMALREREAFAGGPVLYWHTYGAPST